jgi:GMP synthase-like glutamine amidotransferase
MESVLILKNVENEGPGTIGDHLQAHNIPFRIVELSKGEQIPETDKYTSLVIMGGAMSVHDTAKYPYLKTEEDLVRKFLSGNRKVLGICLGAQIMAKALDLQKPPCGIPA